MPDITTAELFPSAKFIATDNKGDLQEVTGVEAAKAKLIHSGVTFEAKNTGAAGNAISVEIAGNAGITGAIQVTKTGAAILIETPTAAATKAEFVNGGLTLRAKAAGVAGNSLKVRLQDNQSVTGVEVTEASGHLTIKLQNGFATYTQNEIATAVTAASLSDFDLIISNGATNLTGVFATYQNLAGGQNAVYASNYTQGEIKTAVDAAGVAITDSIEVQVAVSGSNLSGALAATALAGGQDEVTPDLDTNAKYLLLKESDLYDFESSEATDGRKVFWGILHNASEVWASKASQPDSLKIARSAVASTDGGAALRQIYTITAKYAISGLDLKAES